MKVFGFGMDKRIVAAEEIQQRSDSAAFASKSSESLIQINAIAIDLPTAMEETKSPARDHFSIRGYVAGMREKDRNSCLPFVSEDNDGNIVDYLPPLTVPRFRWWSDCLPDMSTERTQELMIVSAGRSDVGTSSCNNINGGKDGLLIHRQGNIGNKNGLRDCGSEEDNVPISSLMRNPSLYHAEGNKSVSCSKDKTDYKDNEAGSPCASIPEANPPVHIRESHNNTADVDDVARVSVRPSCTVDEADNASSESEGTKSSLPPRRKPKLRSLADLMEEERNPTKNNNSATRSSSSSGMVVRYTESEAVLPPQPQLDDPADVAKGARSPPRKRKFVLEEERGPFGKRSRGVVLDAARTHDKRAKLFESEMEGNASARLDSQSGSKADRMRPRKNKALEIGKKTREVQKVNDANTPKPAVNSEGSFGYLRHGPSTTTLGETRPYFSGFLSGHEFGKVSNFSKGKNPEVRVDYDRAMPPPPSKSVGGDFSSKGKVALDLSLNSFVGNSDDQSPSLRPRCMSIPDLNETFTHQTVARQENQFLPILSERSFPMNIISDASASCSRETTREGKRPLLVSEPQNRSANIELGSGPSDDIPMEIVELLARNQRERALGNSRKHLDLFSEEVNNSFRCTPPHYLDGRHPSMISFPQTSRSGVTITNGNVGLRQPQSPINYPGPSNNRRPEESPFRLFTQSQQMNASTQYSPSSSMMTRPRASERAELVWPPRRENGPFHLNIPQNQSSQTNSLPVHIFPKGKTVSDVKGSAGKKGSLIHGRPAVIKEGVVRSGSTCLDPYNNEAIPAMQLLSLMDQGIVSGSSSFKVGPKSYLDKPFTPCNVHPRLSGNESQKVGSFFPQNSNSKGFSGKGHGVFCAGQSSKRASSHHRQGQINAEVGKSKATHLEGHSNRVILTERSTLELGPCTLNRNPADFSVPDARNKFTRKGTGKPGSGKVDGRTKPRARKYAPNEYLRK